MIEDTD